VDSHNPEVVPSDFALARMQPGAQANSYGWCCVNYRFRAANGTRGALEGCEETVTSRVHLATAEPAKLISHHPIVRVERRPPSTVAHGRKMLRRADDVGEQHGREDSIDVHESTLTDQEIGDFITGATDLLGAGEGIRQRDQAGSLDVVGQEAPVRWWEEIIGRTVQHQCGRTNER